MEFEKYPIFCGRVIKVHALLEDESGSYSTIIKYLSPQDQTIPFELANKIILGIVDDFELQSLEEKVQTVSIPLRLDPFVVEGAEIRTRFGKIHLDEEDEENTTFEVEIIEGSNRYLTDLHRLTNTTPFSGLTYIKILTED